MARSESVWCIYESIPVGKENTLAKNIQLQRKQKGSYEGQDIASEVRNKIRNNQISHSFHLIFALEIYTHYFACPSPTQMVPLNQY